MARQHETPLLEARNLVRSYKPGRSISFRQKDDVLAVKGISFSLNRERTLGVVGESGSGKSTTARMLLGLERPTRGEVLFKGQSVYDLDGSEWQEFRRSVQSVFQDPWSSLNPRRTIGQSVEDPLTIMTSLTTAERADRVAELLQFVGLDPSISGNYPHELSGGMRQRVSIARAIAPSPACIILDEPVSALDVSIKAQIMNLLKDLQDRLQVAMVLIAHDLATVRFLADTVVVMLNGRIVEMASTAELFAEPGHPYTQELLTASTRSLDDVDDAGHDTQRFLLGAEGSATLGQGCSYLGECPLSLSHPQASNLVGDEEGHFVACHIVPN